LKQASIDLFTLVCCQALLLLLLSHPLLLCQPHLLEVWYAVDEALVG
jgi:hypothetical protein